MAAPKGIALVLGMGKPKGEAAKPPPAAPSEDEYGSELAGMLGVGEADKPAFISALTGFVRACARKEEGGDYEESDADEAG